MKRRCHCTSYFFVTLIALLGVLIPHGRALADPSRYPQFAQQALPNNVPVSFVSIDQLVEEIGAGKKPLIIDVRTEEEYREVHILGAVSAPLERFKSYVEKIPKDRLVILY
jgi:Rhodanese-like domain